MKLLIFALALLLLPETARACRVAPPTGYVTPLHRAVPASLQADWFVAAVTMTGPDTAMVRQVLRGDRRIRRVTIRFPQSNVISSCPTTYVAPGRGEQGIVVGRVDAQSNRTVTLEPLTVHINDPLSELPALP